MEVGKKVPISTSRKGMEKSYRKRKDCLEDMSKKRGEEKSLP